MLRREPRVHYLTTKRRDLAGIPPELRAAIRGLVAGESPWPLYCYGPAGTGKTCAALCLLDHAGGLYFTASGLVDELIRAQNGRLRGREVGHTIWPEALWGEIASTALVVLDELGTREKASDFAFDCLKRAIDDREGRPLVCLSNLSLPRLAHAYDDRIASRLSAGTVVELRGPDRRLLP